MLHLILGEQGAGKTLCAIAQAFIYYKKGYKIYSNVHLRFPYTKIKYKDIIACKYENAFILIDEIHQLLPARNSMSKTSRLITDSFLSMIRKKGIELYGTTQTPRKVDVRYREEVNYITTCSKFAFLNRKWTKTNKELNSDVPCIIKTETINIFNHSTKRNTIFANRFYDLYDTNQIIMIEGL